MGESRTKNTLLNIGFSFIYQILNIILGFLNRTIFIYVLGVNYLGLSGLFKDILTMLSLSDLGLNVALTYSMYEPLAKKDYKKLAALTNFYRRVYHIIAIVFSLIGISLIPFLKYIINLKHPIPYTNTYYILFLANTVSSYLVVYKTSILTADQKDYILNKYKSIFSFFQTAFMTLFLWLTHSYFIYLFIQLIFTYTQNFYCSHVAVKLYPFIEKKITVSRREVRTLLKNIYSVSIYKVSGVLLSATDNMIISIMIGTSIVGIYSNYSMIIVEAQVVINTIFYSITASLGNLIVNSNKEERYKVFLTMQIISDIISCVCVSCFIFLLQDFMSLWLGSHFLINKYAFAAVILNFYLQVNLMPVWVYREATGLYQQTKYVMLLTAIINLALSVVLGKSIGLAGILFASAISRLVTYFWYEPIILFRLYFSYPSYNYFLIILRNIIVIFIVLIVNWLLFKNFLSNNWVLFIVKTLLVGVSSLVLTILLYVRTRGFNLLFNRIKGIVFQKK